MYLPDNEDYKQSLDYLKSLGFKVIADYQKVNSYEKVKDKDKVKTETLVKMEIHRMILMEILRVKDKTEMVRIKTNRIKMVKTNRIKSRILRIGLKI